MLEEKNQTVPVQPAAKRMPRWARVLIGLGIAMAAGVAYLWLFGTQTFVVLESRQAARKLPYVKLTPVALTDLSVSKAPGMKLSYVGYEFEVPWTDLDEARTKVIGGKKAIIVFHTGNVLSVWSGPPHELRDGMLNEWRMDPETFANIYGREALQSDYKFMRNILEATPQGVSIFDSRSRAVRQSMLLLAKVICVPGDPNSGIFAVRGGEFPGFQYGLPQALPKRLNVELFPEDGHLDLMFGQKPDGPAIITQADVNRVIQTIRAAPAKHAVLATPCSSTEIHN